MNILILNGNPKLNNSSAKWFYTPFIESLRENGNEIKIIYLQRKTIKACKGCLHCWFIDQGKCIISDDFESIVRWLNWADQLFFIFPIYVGNPPSIIFNFIQRIVSLVKPTYELINDHYGHVLNDSISFPSFGVISWCGFYEDDNFETIKLQMKQLEYSANAEYNFSIFRPHITAFDFFQEKRKSIIDNIKIAGKQFSDNLNIEKTVIDNIEKEIVSSNEYLLQMNNLLKSKTNANKK